MSQYARTKKLIQVLDAVEDVIEGTENLINNPGFLEKCSNAILRLIGKNVFKTLEK